MVVLLEPDSIISKDKYIVEYNNEGDIKSCFLVCLIDSLRATTTAHYI